MSKIKSGAHKASAPKEKKMVRKQKNNLASTKSIKTRLGLKEIPSVGFDFDDVIENVEKLLEFYFPEYSKGIKEKIYRLSARYAEQIDDDYEEFISLVNTKKDLGSWRMTVVPNYKQLSPVEDAVLDLYFQINLVRDYDVYNDVLIYAYLEDIQPQLK